MYKLPDPYNCNIGIIGLGYVGLPLALEFYKTKFCVKTGKPLKRNIIGFEINQERVKSIQKGIDVTNEVDNNDMDIMQKLFITNNYEELSEVDIFIVTVPTPIDSSNNPNLTPILSACETISKAINTKKSERLSGTLNSPIIILESTVYPGLTEEVVVPLIEKNTKLKYNNFSELGCFFCGYSPERVNPGDKKKKLKDITKVTSGSNTKVALIVDNIYSSIITSGTFMASSIKVAEAAKVIENTQRDLNIALMNELAKIFDKLDINTLEVLEAASTKWNFMKFQPGLVGGHCIGVDPYYLAYISEKKGYTSNFLLQGRNINNSMAGWIVEKIKVRMDELEVEIPKSSALILGFTFKENCPDIRNTKVIDVIREMELLDINVDVYDPLADREKAFEAYGLKLKEKKELKSSYDVICLLVAHNEFLELSSKEWDLLGNDKSVYFDLKGIIPDSNKLIKI